jgi:hypothetical protein
LGLVWVSLLRLCGIWFEADSERGTGRLKHTLDTTFFDENAKMPGVILEISYSQNRKDVRRLADWCSVASNGDVRVVLGFDIEYNQKDAKDVSKEAVFTVWRPEEVSNSLLCKQKVRHVSSLKLTSLRLSDIMPNDFEPAKALQYQI